MEGRVVLDTNVLVAGLRSRKGASFAVLELVEAGAVEICLSAPLVLEYEEALMRHLGETNLPEEKLGRFLDSLCSLARLQDIFFLWRPCLRDPKDDLVLEIAVAGQCGAIVTHNRRDFGGADRFGVQVITPAQLLRELGE